MSTKKTRRTRAKRSRKARDKRSSNEQLFMLDDLLGYYKGATKERYRLEDFGDYRARGFQIMTTYDPLQAVGYSLGQSVCQNTMHC